MSKCPLCGSELIKNLPEARQKGYAIPILSCGGCAYNIAQLPIHNEEFSSSEAITAFEKLEELNAKILEKTALHDTIKNLADR